MNLRRAGAVALFVVSATSCTAGTDPTSITGAIQQEKQAQQINKIKPPPAPDLLRSGRVGLILETNSVGWQRTLGTPARDGAVVVFVLPGSPAERAGVRRSDLIVNVGPTSIRNDERARVALRGRIGVPLTVRVLRKEGAVDVKVAPGDALSVDLIPLYDKMIRVRSTDAVALLLRGEATSEPQQALSFVNRAIDAEPDFVDALVYRARLFWTESEQIANETVAQEDQQRARSDWDRALQIDSRSTSALVGRASALFETQAFGESERDALRAIAVDPTLSSAHLVLAQADLALGKPREAATPAREAVRLAPYDAPTYRALALTFLALGRRADAEATIRAGLTVADTDSERAALQAVLDRTPG